MKKKIAAVAAVVTIVAASVATPIALRGIPAVIVDSSPYLFVYQGDTSELPEALTNIEPIAITVWGTVDIDGDGIKEWHSHDVASGAGYIRQLEKGTAYILTYTGTPPLTWILSTGGIGPHLPIDVVDADFNNDGVLCTCEYDRLHARNGAMLGEPNYERQYDLNFDDVIDGLDEIIFNATIHIYPKLSYVQNTISTGEYEKLTWPDDGTEVWIASCSPNEADISTFTGNYLGTPGWISVIRSDYDDGCACKWYSHDTAIAAYKALGYGRFLIAWSFDHAYIMFWTGGDWRDLNNWKILEPQDGTVKVATIITTGQYDTMKVYFPLYSDGTAIYCKTLNVVKPLEYLYYNEGIFQIPIGAMEEPAPSTFNTSLGIPKDIL